MRRILGGEADLVVAEDVRAQRVLAAERVVETRLARPEGERRQPRRPAHRAQHHAAGPVERQAQAEAPADANLGHALQHLLRCQQVEAAELVIRAEIAPGGALWPSRPSRPGQSPALLSRRPAAGPPRASPWRRAGRSGTASHRRYAGPGRRSRDWSGRGRASSRGGASSPAGDTTLMQPATNVHRQILPEAQTLRPSMRWNPPSPITRRPPLNETGKLWRLMTPGSMMSKAQSRAGSISAT